MTERILHNPPHTREQSNTDFTRAQRAQRRYMRAGENGAAQQWEKVSRGADGRTLQELEKNFPGKDSSIFRNFDPSTLPITLLMGAALLTLELTNAATSYYALDSLMGTVGLGRASFAMLLTLGLTTLDAGGLYRLFAPSTAGESNRSFGLWCAMGAWLLCATLNAVLTWYAVTDAMATTMPSNAVLAADTLLDVAPVALALALWLMRLLLVAGWAQGERG